MVCVTGFEPVISHFLGEWISLTFPHTDLKLVDRTGLEPMPLQDDP